MAYHPSTEFEFNQITENIFVGTNQCCQTHYRRQLLDEGITADISLEKEHIDAPYGAAYFVWIPVVDHSAPSQEQLNFGVSTIEKLLSLNKKVYIHCKEGHGRAPTLAAAYLIKQGRSVKEAISAIKAKRPEAHPNPKQLAALKKYMASLA